MSDVFTPVELEWDGKIYTVPSNRVMGLISQVEDVITFGELQEYAIKQTGPISKLCMAYGKALRYAGAKTTDDEIYAAIFSGPEGQAAVSAALVNLMTMMLPVEAREKVNKILNGEVQPGSGTGGAPGNRAAAATGSSKARSNSVVGRRKKAGRG